MVIDCRVSNFGLFHILIISLLSHSWIDRAHIYRIIYIWYYFFAWLGWMSMIVLLFALYNFYWLQYCSVWIFIHLCHCHPRYWALRNKKRTLLKLVCLTFLWALKCFGSSGARVTSKDIFSFQWQCFAFRPFQNWQLIVYKQAYLNILLKNNGWEIIVEIKDEKGSYKVISLS